MSLPTSIERWKDSSQHVRHYTQTESDHQPEWDGKVFDFDGDDDHLIQNTGSAIICTDEFTIGFTIACDTADYANIISIADSTTNADFIRINNSEVIHVKAAGEMHNITLDQALPDGVPCAIVVQRVASHECTIYIDGTAQADTVEFSPSKPMDIDTIGCRNSELNDFVGGIGEVIVYSCGEEATRKSVIDRLEYVKAQMR